MIQSLVIGLVTGGIYGLLALFVAWIVVVEFRLPWILGAIAAVAAAIAIGLLFERLVVRPMTGSSRLAVAVATVGLLTLLLGIEQYFNGITPRFLPAPIAGRGPIILGVYIAPSTVIALGVIVALSAGLAAFLRFTDFGLAVQAAAQDPVAARLVGIPAGRVSAFTWGAAAGIAAMAALLIEPVVGVFLPGYVTTLFVGALAAALVGGLTSLPGAFVGGIAVGVARNMVSWALRSSDLAHALHTNTLPGFDTLTLFVIILVVLLVRPQGLFGRMETRNA
jgi:branched-chain amino acid transport system permease protein